jgi:hypothetical protein
MTFSGALAAVALAAAAAGAGAGPLDVPMEAIRAGSCERLGAWVNDRDAGAQSARDAMAAVMYTEGFCVDAQPERALAFYRAATTEPDVGAASSIGMRYVLGDGVPQSYRKAGLWLTFAESILQRAQNPGAGETVLTPIRFDSAEQPGDVWRGYLISMHYVATQILRRARGPVQTVQPADVMVTLCVKDGQLATVIMGRAEDATRAAARLKAEQDVLDSYRRAEKLLPQAPLDRVRTASGVPCVQRAVSYRLS